ncbi:MAG: DegV family protein [Chloroflexota bacterium]|nr:DegV family protein [Chloroflexota bacterium]
MMITKKIRFVTDSTCDLPQALIDRYQITVVPCFINYNDESLSDDGVGFNREQFYGTMETMRPPYPTTAAMSPGMAEEAIARVAHDADHVFIVSVASTLSGVYNVMRLGARALPADSYTLIDSETTTMGLGYQVLIGAEVAEATGDVAQVAAAIARVREHQHVYAALSTLEYLRRSGRVKWATAGIGGLLKISPLLYVHGGEAEAVVRVRTFARVIDKLVSRVESHLPLERLTLLYAGDESLADSLRDRLSEILPKDVMTIRVTPTIGVHLGAYSVGAVALSSAWRN